MEYAPRVKFMSLVISAGSGETGKAILPQRLIGEDRHGVVARFRLRAPGAWAAVCTGHSGSLVKSSGQPGCLLLKNSQQTGENCAW